MRIIFIVILLGLLLVLMPSAPKAEAVAPACPAGYEYGYVWTPCFEYQGVEGCYGIRDDGMTNSVISCPLACCEDNYDGYVEWQGDR